MMGNVYGYIRVSSTDQNEDRQLIAMQKMEVQRKICILTNSRVRTSIGRNTNGWSSG